MITGRYVLLIHIPLYRLPDGQVATMAEWEHDLSRHFDYISNLAVCSPVENATEMKANWRLVPALQEAERILPLRPRGGWVAVLRNLVSDFRVIRRAVREADIVHSGAAGWPVTLSVHLLLLRPFHSFRWIFVIESSAWMADKDAGIVRRVTGAMISALVGLCARSADIRIVTQRWYQDRFATGRKPTLVAPAVWVTADAIREKLGPEDDAIFADPNLRIVMATRLVEEKGVADFLAALERIDADPDDGAPPVYATLLGDGPMKSAALETAARMGRRVKLNVAGVLSYGEPFFAALRAHHLMVATNRSAEQPRNIYDAFSQGRGVLSARTPGTVDAIEMSGAGELFAPRDVAALADLLRKYARDPSSARSLAERALAFARGRTHEGMHQERHAFLEAYLPSTKTSSQALQMDL